MPQMVVSDNGTELTSGAVQSAPTAVAESIQLFGPPSSEVKGGAEKLLAETEPTVLDRTLCWRY